MITFIILFFLAPSKQYRGFTVQNPKSGQKHTTFSLALRQLFNLWKNLAHLYYYIY